MKLTSDRIQIWQGANGSSNTWLGTPPPAVQRKIWTLTRRTGCREVVGHLSIQTRRRNLDSVCQGLNKTLAGIQKQSNMSSLEPE